MKKLLLFALSALTIVSCKKSGNDGSSSSATNTSAYNALSIHTTAQSVKMAVTSNILNMVYNEDVTLVLDSDKLAGNWAVHLKEDFSGTQLSKYDYRSLTRYGVYANNWVDDNLNNIILHSSKDTVINGKMYVKKRITRTFIYQKAYDSSVAATAVLNQLLKQSDIISFSSYYYSPENTETNKTVNTAKLTYERM